MNLTMELTAAQMATFFKDDEQMGILHTTVIQLQTEGITTVGDLADFEKDSLQQLGDNLHCPGGRIPDPSTNAAAGATIPMPTSTFGAKSQKRLHVACDLIQYYNTTGQDLTAANMQWTHGTCICVFIGRVDVMKSMNHLHM